MISALFAYCHNTGFIPYRPVEDGRQDEWQNAAKPMTESGRKMHKNEKGGKCLHMTTVWNLLLVWYLFLGVSFEFWVDQE